MWEKAEPVLAEAGVTAGGNVHYRQALMACRRVANDALNLCLPTGHGQREKSVRDLVRGQSSYACDWDLFDRVTAVFFDLFDQEQDLLPPDPWFGFEKKQRLTVPRPSAADCFSPGLQGTDNAGRRA